MNALDRFVNNRKKIDRYPEDDVHILEEYVDISTGGIKGYKVDVFDGF